ncbi:HU family DNA-binding protein [Leptolyngbya sp. FACHB-261]|uniref:HU family DNA-binding protein n=1 Tax=Leptolyngbya sp. FACHB-261 TaxID=2692806 RepID=UPI00168A311F|nr:HU family DNA-binding protein [Leptolyngbya sp. FACHB-261]MBD2102720.1 HU family DNA-binding protein [Leptolyngbya sp. FACHB-261]
MADLNRQDLVRNMVDQVDGLSHSLASASLDALITTLTDALSQHKSVTLSGFGTFRVRYRRPRSGIHPRTREPLTIPGAYVPAFVPGPTLCQRLQSSNPQPLPSDPL